MAARRKFLFNYDQVVSYCNGYKPAFGVTAAALEVHEEELKERWNTFMNNYREIATADDDVYPKDLTDIAVTKYNDAFSKYENCKTRINSLKPKHHSKADESSRLDTTINLQGFSSLKLPPCDIQNFEGGYSKWPAFRDIFWGVFGSHPEISPAQKLSYLLQKTRGEAHQIVKGYDLVDKNFEIAWKALKDRYENTRILVHQQMKYLFGLQAAPHENPKAIRQIQRCINDSLSIFKTYNVSTENWFPFLVYHCSTKLPEETLRAWENSLTDHKELPTWDTMNDFLSKRIEMLETVFDMKKSTIRDNHYSNQRAQSFHSHMDSNRPKVICKKCKKDDHKLHGCDSFRGLSVKERVNFVYSNKICSNCLGSNHFKDKCPSERSCAKCGRKHHTLLHFEKQEERYAAQNRSGFQPRAERQSFLNSTQQQPSSSTAQTNTTVDDVQTHLAQNEGTTILPTALINLDHAGELITIRALLDAGSERSFISKRIQESLGIPVSTRHSRISGLGGTVVGNSSHCCTVSLRSRASNFTIKIKAIVVPKLAHFLPSKLANIENLLDLKKLKLADPNFHKPSSIDMIIGSDYLPLINLQGVLTNFGHGLEARESHFGWYLSGPLPSNEIQTFSTLVSDKDDVNLTDQIRKFWEIEDIQRPEIETEQDKYCEEFFTKTTYRQPDGRYVVRLPFRPEFPEKIFLGPSKNMALAQYHRMETTLKKSPELQREYENVLHEYVDLAHMEQVNHFESNDEKQFAFYLPHHAVVKPESKTTKVRVVFNGSKKTKSGFSLNDILFPGPVLQSDIIKIILHWRYYQFVFTGDIQKMYRQILVHAEDRPFQRILFRPSTNEGIKSYELKTVTFGINCAPFLAIRTLQRLSDDVTETKPLAAKILKNEIYVDDVLSGGHTIAETKIKQKELFETLSSAAFPLKKITANNKTLLENIAREDLLDEDFLNFDSSSIAKTLGIRWNAMSDAFYYIVGEIDPGPTVTKRKILSVIARLFDPLGWLGPTVIMAKVLMQDLWEEKAGWDEVIPPNLMTKWTTFRENLPKIQSLKIPRYVEYVPEHHVQIHGFCDASEKAYCGAVYIRVNDAGKFSSHLLVAKTRVAPLKKTTTPKLELCGAVLLAHLVKTATETLNIEHEIYLWTDSAIVLGWLQRPPQTLKTFVANRVTEILSMSSITTWKHVGTEDNPADLGTRGCSPQELINHNLWWHGPPWLQKPQLSWPKPKSFDPTDLEVKKVSTFHLIINADIIERFSSFNRALRVMSYVFRFIHSCRKMPLAKTHELSADEITSTKNSLLCISQKIYFHKEYESLSNNEEINNKSRLLTLSPFLDKTSLLRVRGRLENSELSQNEKHPVILHEHSHFAKLLVAYTHQILMHGEYNIMLRAIRQGFYIPRLKNLIRKCIRGCKSCTIYKRNFQNQVMAALPPERVTFSLPFTYAGVDFTGPFNLKTSTLRNAKIVKGYAAVFVCFSTKAVHLEVCSELSADAFLATFTRFTGRRGLPKTMFSDNGRNFVGASYQLLKEHNLFLKKAEVSLIEKYSTHGFSWSFIPPHAPHMGGLWEAAVKSMKSHLKKVTSNISFTFEEFSTILVRIESILNSRPLSPMSENPSELLPLTPGHFLRGGPLVAPLETPFEPLDTNLSHINRWKRLKALQHVFSQRWKSEYITELQRRYKWKTSKNNLKENDFVIIKEDSLPPTEWRLGRIIKVFTGSDNQVRVAEIKTQNGVIKRPVVKLCVLPTQNPKE